MQNTVAVQAALNNQLKSVSTQCQVEAEPSRGIGSIYIDHVKESSISLEYQSRTNF